MNIFFALTHPSGGVWTKEWKVKGSWLLARLQIQNKVNLALLLEQSKVNKLLADLSFLESEAATCLGYG